MTGETKTSSDAPVNALFASAFSLAASALASSEISCKLSFASCGDGGWEVDGEDSGVEEVSLLLDMVCALGFERNQIWMESRLWSDAFISVKLGNNQQLKR